eukprot:scaffold2952_cov312-Pinguiococcus_pyrenoidosus.AAC.15
MRLHLGRPSAVQRNRTRCSLPRPHIRKLHRLPMLVELHGEREGINCVSRRNHDLPEQDAARVAHAYLLLRSSQRFRDAKRLVARSFLKDGNEAGHSIAELLNANGVRIGEEGGLQLSAQRHIQGGNLFRGELQLPQAQLPSASFRLERQDSDPSDPAKSIVILLFCISTCSMAATTA